MYMRFKLIPYKKFEYVRTPEQIDAGEQLNALYKRLDAAKKIIFEQQPEIEKEYNDMCDQIRQIYLN